jgi:hypothetical protein
VRRERDVSGTPQIAKKRYMDQCTISAGPLAALATRCAYGARAPRATQS